MIRSWHVATLVVGAMAIPALAGSVNLNTYATDEGSGWTVNRYQTADSVATYVNHSVMNTNVPYAWIQPDQFPTYGHPLSWVTTSDSAGTSRDTNGTVYAYQRAFRLDVDIQGNSKFVLEGELSTDNWVTDASLAYQQGALWNSVDVVLTSESPTIFTVGDHYEFTYRYKISASVAATSFVSPADFLLTINTVNSYQPESDYIKNGANPGPAGLIFAGQAIAVPLPAAAWMGFSLLSGLGIVSAARKRLGCA